MIEDELYMYKYRHLWLAFHCLIIYQCKIVQNLIDMIISDRGCNIHKLVLKTVLEFSEATTNSYISFKSSNNRKNVDFVWMKYYTETEVCEF